MLQTRAAKRLKKQLAQAHAIPSDLEDDDDIGYDEIDIYVAYRRPEIVHDNPDKDELSPYITVRLALARAKAMAKYREVWG